MNQQRDIDSLIRSNFEFADSIVKSFKSEEVQEQIKQEMSNFEEIRDVLFELSKKIESNDAYSTLAKRRKKSRELSFQNDGIEDIVLAISPEK